jgi:predicted nucleic acid-binding protein
VIGTLGLLLEAKRAGHVTTIRADLDKLVETSFFLSPQLYDHVLRMAGEHLS